jgi:hypothetical protein
MGLPAPAELCAPIGSIGTNTAAVGSSLSRQTGSIADQGLNDHVFSAATAGSTGFTAVPGVFASGRLARTEHDGGTGRTGGGDVFGMTGYESDESSVYVNAQYQATFGNNSILKITPFIGGARNELDYDNINIDINAAGGGFLYTYNGQLGSAENESLMGGVSLLYAVGQTYGGLTVAADAGETDYVIQSIQQIGSYDTQGYTVTGALGQSLTISNQLFLDVRGNLLYSRHTGDAHRTTATGFGALDVDIGKSVHEVFSGTTSLMLYGMYVENDNAYRPFVKVAVKHEFDEENSLFIPQQYSYQNGGTATFEDDDTFFNVEAGFDAALGQQFTFLGAAYYETSGDENAFGGRVSLQYKFN